MWGEGFRVSQVLIRPWGASEAFHSAFFLPKTSLFNSCLLKRGSPRAHSLAGVLKSFSVWSVKKSCKLIPGKNSFMAKSANTGFAARIADRGNETPFYCADVKRESMLFKARL